jgi:hypothetical protein
MKMRVVFLLSFIVILTVGFKNHQHTKDCPKGCKVCKNAIEKGISYILKKQKRWGGWDDGYLGRTQISITALCGLALLAHGSSTKDGRYSDAVKKILRYLLKKIKKSGGIRSAGRFETWHIVFTSLFLSEIYKRDGLSHLKGKLALLGKRLKKLQWWKGGWCHNRPGAWRPGYGYDLVAVTNFVILAIKALQGCGIEFPENLFEKVKRYYKKAQNRNGGFKYSISYRADFARRSEAGRTAGAIHALMLLGMDMEDSLIQKALRFLKKRFKKFPNCPPDWPFTINYLMGALACNYLGDKYWQRYVKIYYPKILRGQKRKGYFLFNRKRPHKIYTTAVALLVLQLRLGSLSFLEKRRAPRYY